MQLDMFATPAPTMARAAGETTVRAIGRCVVKGCKQRKRNTYAGRIVTSRNRTHTEWGIATKYGPVSPYSHWDGATPTVARLLDAYARTDGLVVEFILAMRGAGWICPDHDRVMRVVTVAGTVNTEKVCDSRCMGATGPACDCACGGDNHGARWA